MGTWIFRAAGVVFWLFALTSSGYATIDAVQQNNLLVATICFSLMVLLSLSGQSIGMRRAWAVPLNSEGKPPVIVAGTDLPTEATIHQIHQNERLEDRPSVDLAGQDRVRAYDLWINGGSSDRPGRTSTIETTPAKEWESGQTVQAINPPTMIPQEDSILSMRAAPLEEGENLELVRQLRITFCREDYSVAKRLINAQCLVRSNGHTFLEAHCYSDCGPVSYRLEQILEIHDKRSGVTQTEDLEEWLCALATLHSVKDAAE